MGNAVFPTLPGLKWGVTKTPIWSTQVQKSISGRELRAGAVAARENGPRRPARQRLRPLTRGIRDSPRLRSGQANSPIPAAVVLQYNGGMKKALRYPSRWAGRMHTLGTMAVLSVALGACANPFGTPGGTIEYPGSGAGPNAVAVYVVNEKDTVASISRRYGVSEQTIIDRNNLKAPYTLKAGQNLMLPGAKFRSSVTTSTCTAGE